MLQDYLAWSTKFGTTMKGNMNCIKPKIFFPGLHDDVTLLVSSLIENVFLLVVPLLACLSFAAHTMPGQCSVLHIHLLIFDHDSGSPQLFLKPFVVECAIFLKSHVETGVIQHTKD